MLIFSEIWFLTKNFCLLVHSIWQLGSVFLWTLLSAFSPPFAFLMVCLAIMHSCKWAKNMEICQHATFSFSFLSDNLVPRCSFFRLKKFALSWEKNNWINSSQWHWFYRLLAVIRAFNFKLDWKETWVVFNFFVVYLL